MAAQDVGVGAACQCTLNAGRGAIAGIDRNALCAQVDLAANSPFTVGKMNRILATILIILFTPAFVWPAFGWTEPARGSADRAKIMDALRPLAEWSLDAPIEFVVDDLRVQGDVAFAMVSPQRPGGTQIDLYKTPMVLRDGQDPQYMDGARIDALLKRSGKTWVAVHWAIGASDVWWADPAFCPDYAEVIPEVCR